jgi:hypothetical protein
MRWSSRHNDGSSCRRRQRQDHPKHEIKKGACSANQKRKQPHDPDDCRIHVEVVGNTGADATQFFVPTGTHEALWGKRRRGGRRWRGRRKLCAAVVAKLGIIDDFLLAIWANHSVPPLIRILNRCTREKREKFREARKPRFFSKLASLRGRENSSSQYRLQYSRSLWTAAVMSSVCGRMASSRLGW